MITFACPVCNTTYDYPEAMAGQKIRCSGANCHQKLRVPTPETITTPDPGHVVSAVPMPAREKPHPSHGLHQAPQRPHRGGVFEGLGIGVFAIVAAVILTGLFAVLFPLMRRPATSAGQPDTQVVQAGDGSSQAAAKSTAGRPSVITPPTKPVPTVDDPGTQYNRALKSVVWIQATDRKKVWGGTGSLIDRENRLVLTNQHVANEAAELIVVMFPVFRDKKVIVERTYYQEELKKGNASTGRLVQADIQRDLAVIQLDKVPDDAVALRLAKESVTPRQAIFCIGGNPAGNEQGMWIPSEGKVRQVYHHKWQYDDGLPREADIIASNLGTNPGDSGGPILDDRGLLVGVNAIGASDKNPGKNQNVKHIDITEVRAFLPLCYRLLGLSWKEPD